MRILGTGNVKAKGSGAGKGGVSRRLGRLNLWGLGEYRKDRSVCRRHCNITSPLQLKGASRALMVRKVEK